MKERTGRGRGGTWRQVGGGGNGVKEGKKEEGGGTGTQTRRETLRVSD